MEGHVVNMIQDGRNVGNHGRPNEPSKNTNDYLKIREQDLFDRSFQLNRFSQEPKPATMHRLRTGQNASTHGRKVISELHVLSGCSSKFR